MLLLVFFHIESLSFISVWQEKCLSVSYSGLPQSFNQNTEQDTLPLLYKATKGSKSRGKYDF